MIERKGFYVSRRAFLRDWKKDVEEAIETGKIPSGHQLVARPARSGQTRQLELFTRPSPTAAASGLTHSKPLVRTPRIVHRGAILWD